jgi:predicted ATPase
LRSEFDWRGHPTVLAVEDVHWADEASLDVLRYLVRRISELPVVLLLTYRDEEIAASTRCGSCSVWPSTRDTSIGCRYGP